VAVRHRRPHAHRSRHDAVGRHELTFVVASLPRNRPPAARPRRSGTSASGAHDLQAPGDRSNQPTLQVSRRVEATLRRWRRLRSAISAPCDQVDLEPGEPSFALRTIRSSSMRSPQSTAERGVPLVPGARSRTAIHGPERPPGRSDADRHQPTGAGHPRPRSGGSPSAAAAYAQARGLRTT
jgi:hypothetical protein